MVSQAYFMFWNSLVFEDQKYWFALWNLPIWKKHNANEHMVNQSSQSCRLDTVMIEDKNASRKKPPTVILYQLTLIDKYFSINKMLVQDGGGAIGVKDFQRLSCRAVLQGLNGPSPHHFPHRSRNWFGGWKVYRKGWEGGRCHGGRLAWQIGLGAGKEGELEQQQQQGKTVADMTGKMNPRGALSRINCVFFPTWCSDKLHCSTLSSEFWQKLCPIDPQQDTNPVYCSASKPYYHRDLEFVLFILPGSVEWGWGEC